MNSHNSYTPANMFRTHVVGRVVLENDKLGDFFFGSFLLHFLQVIIRGKEDHGCLAEWCCPNDDIIGCTFYTDRDMKSYTVL